MNAPKLRFKEFTDPWVLYPISEIATINPKSDELPNTFIYIDLESVESGKLLYKNIIHKDNAPSRAQRLLKHKDILIQTVRPYQKNHLLYKNLEIDSVASTGYALLRTKKEIEPAFVYQLFFTDRVNFEINKRCTGTSYPAISSSDLSDILLYTPKNSEQVKISSFLSALDKKIQLQQEKIDLLKQQKKGFMQKIFSQELRFKSDNGQEFPEWEQIYVKDVLRLTLREIPKPKSAYIRLGLRSHCKGTFHELVTDVNEVSMDTLFEVHEGDFIVNITFAWEQALAVANLEDHGKLVSHRFPTYRFKDTHEKSFYKYFFATKYFKYCLGNASPGGAGRNRVLNKKDFFNIEIVVPSKSEQIKIGTFLDKLDKKITTSENLLNSLLQQKKAFMQQMFI